MGASLVSECLKRQDKLLPPPPTPPSPPRRRGGGHCFSRNGLLGWEGGLLLPSSNMADVCEHKVIWHEVFR